MTTRSDERIRQAYQSLPYSPNEKDWNNLLEDNNRLRLALSEAVSQIQQLNAQLDYTRALNANLDGNNRG
jgi:hypothetical protein